MILFDPVNSFISTSTRAMIGNNRKSRIRMSKPIIPIPCIAIKSFYVNKTLITGYTHLVRISGEVTI